MTSTVLDLPMVDDLLEFEPFESNGHKPEFVKNGSILVGHPSGVYRPVKSIFEESYKQYFAKYKVTIQGRSTMIGSCPRDPDQFRRWTEGRVLDNDASVRFHILKMADEQGVTVDPNATVEQMLEIANKVLGNQSGNVFWRIPEGLAYGGYQVFACLRESVSIAFPWGKAGWPQHRWGPTGKAPYKYFNDACFIEEDRILLRDGNLSPITEALSYPHVGQVTGPRGQRSILTYLEYVEQPILQFHICSWKQQREDGVEKDGISLDKWERILAKAEATGLGASRSMQHGKFGVIGFEQVS